MAYSYKPGSWNCICDVCGQQFKSEQVKQRWDGLMVCRKDWETRHPQEFIQIPKDNPAPPWTRPDSDTSTLIVCTFLTSQAIAGVGTAGCMKAGYKLF